MKYIYKIILFYSFVLLSCTDEVEFNDLAVVTLNIESWIANDSDTAIFTVKFNDDTVLDKITANVTITNGSFTENELQELSFKPKRTPENTIESQIIVKSSTTDSNSNIVFNINEYKQEFTINSTVSSPDKISLTASSFAVQNDFGSEITLTGTLKNSKDKLASKGISVDLEDVFINGELVNGRYRSESLISNSKSQISAVYTVGNITPNQDVFIIASVLDENGIKTQIKDSVQIFVKPKE